MKINIMKISFSLISIVFFYTALYIYSEVVAKKNLTSSWNVLLIIISMIVVTYIMIPCFSLALGILCLVKKHGTAVAILLIVTNLGMCSLFSLSMLKESISTSWLWNLKYLGVMLLFSVAPYLVALCIKKNQCAREH